MSGPLCRRCGSLLDRTLRDLGDEYHPACNPGLQGDHDAALRALAAIFPDALVLSDEVTP
jgi:hypothetical protein